MAHFVRKRQDGDFGRDRRVVVDERYNPRVQTLVDGSPVLLVLLVTLANSSRSACKFQTNMCCSMQSCVLFCLAPKSHTSLSAITLCHL